MNTVNEALRTHVTSTRFVLSLGASHIAALVRIDRELALNHSLEDSIAAGTLGVTRPANTHPLSRIFNLPGSHGLVDRGLITHCTPRSVAEGGNGPHTKPRDIWTITPAGRAVITLLQEAGLWQEYAAALPPMPKPEPAKPRRGRAAA